MLKILGSLILLFGTIGYAVQLCAGRRNKIRFLKSLREMFCLIQGEIEYTMLPLPEIFKNLSGKLEEPLKGALLETGSRLTMEQGRTVRELWCSCMEKAAVAYELSAGQKEILYSFPDGFTGNEYREQAKGLERYIREIEREIKQSEEELKNKNRIIMSLGIAAGLFLVVILL